MTDYLQIRSKRQHIRLWFECYKICLTQPQYSDNLSKSKSFYDEWGDVTDIEFGDWWKCKKYLFDDLYVKEVDKVSKNPNTINLNIPLNQKISTIMKEVKEIVESRQTEKLVELGIDPTTQKSTNLNFGKYTFSKKEIKGRFIHQNIEMYKIYLKHNKPPINRDFLITMYEDFNRRPKTVILNSLYLLNEELYELKNVDLDNSIRTIRRGFKEVEKILNNVSRGSFP